MKRAVTCGGRRIEYILIQSVRRDVLLQALPGGETRVYAPKGMRLKDIDSTVMQHAAEILDMHGSLDQKLRDARAAHPMTEGSTVAVEGTMLPIRLGQGRPGARIQPDAICVTVPDPTDAEAVRALVRQALIDRMLPRLRQRLDHFAPRIGGAYGRVTVREQRSRWGSCSAKHNLNFNWKLIMAPKPVLDYVVIHELCHLHEFNHSPRFWSLVEAQMPEYRVWKKWLKDHGDELGV
ncbi:MAG: M48 family metallopeptidase [Clostridiales bacterium]|nr:M48 family metallopeptidase [Clostridiales bacterium]